MKNRRKLVIVVICMIMAACSSDGSSSTSQPSSRLVKYEISSSSAGNFSVDYISETGAAEHEEFSSVPWTKTFTAEQDVDGVTMQTSISGGTPGKSFTAKIYVGGQVKKQQTTTIQDNGIAVIVLPTYVF